MNAKFIQSNTLIKNYEYVIDRLLVDNGLWEYRQYTSMKLGKFISINKSTPSFCLQSPSFCLQSLNCNITSYLFVNINLLQSRANKLGVSLILSSQEVNLENSKV